MVTASHVKYIHAAFEKCGLSLSDLLLAVLSEKSLSGQFFLGDVMSHLSEILAAFARHQETSRPTRRWMHSEMKMVYHKAIRRLTDKDNGWHLGAVHMSADDILDFKVEDMATGMRELEPDLWELVAFMLSGDKDWSKPSCMEGPVLSWDEIELWNELEEEGSGLASGLTKTDIRKRHRQALYRIVMHVHLYI